MKLKPKPEKKGQKSQRPRGRVVVLDDDDDDDDELELEDVDEFDLAAAAAELEDGGGGGSIRVIKLEPKEEAGACDPYPLSAGPTLTEQLRADWGDGKYAITVRRANGEIYKRGIKQLAKRMTKPTPALDVVQIKRETREELQAQMAPMLLMMQTAFNALIGRPAPAAADPLALIEAVAKVQKLTDRTDGGHKQFLEGIQFAKEVAGTGGNAGFADVAVKFLDKLQFDPTPAKAPASSSPGAPPAAPASREQFMQMVQRALAQRIPILLRGAAQGTEASVYAQLVLDQLDDQYLGIVAEQLKRADWWEQLLAISPAVGTYREWFTALRDEVLREIETPPAPSG